MGLPTSLSETKGEGSSHGVISSAVIKALAGDDFDRARYFPEDGRYLLTRPETVQHYEPTGSPPSLAKG